MLVIEPTKGRTLTEWSQISWKASSERKTVARADFPGCQSRSVCEGEKPPKTTRSFFFGQTAGDPKGMPAKSW